MGFVIKVWLAILLVPILLWLGMLALDGALPLNENAVLTVMGLLWAVLMFQRREQPKPPANKAPEKTGGVK